MSEQEQPLRALGVPQEHLDALQAAGLDFPGIFGLIQGIIKLLVESGIFKKGTTGGGKDPFQ